MRSNRANISLNNGVPTAIDFDDVYFNSDDGVGESTYIFIEGNRLNQRFANLNSSTNTLFTIAETGFGTGLNFILTAQLWLATKGHQPNQLHYISTEKYPIAKDTLKYIYNQQQWDCTITDTIIACYPENPTNGVYTITIENITLTLLIGDSQETLKQRDETVDAWFLDGFTPSKNPQMWTDILFQEMARMSHLQTSFATFTAASAVRKGLQHVGFEVAKRAGFGKKRECISGTFKHERQIT